MPQESSLPLPIAVLVVGLEEHEHPRFAALFDETESRVVFIPDVDTEDLPFRTPDLLLINAEAGANAVIDHVRHARRRWPSPTLITVNVPTPDDAVMLLEAGADDVAMSDGHWGLVGALVGSAMRRARMTNESLRVKFGDIVYDRESRRVWCAGREVEFTPRELRLFDILFQRAGRPVSAETLEDFVWSDGTPTTSNTLAVYIGYLRRKLAGSRASMLETLRGSGYRLVKRD